MSGRDSNFVAIAAIPFFLILGFMVALVTAFPALVLWLPQMLLR
jgi:TRAP-type C4-dicarboxylate transport system permease large subunit